MGRAGGLASDGSNGWPSSPHRSEGKAVSSKPTIIWGVAADSLGLVYRSRVPREDLGGGHYRAYKDDEFKRDTADAHASVHPAPMPMRWHHGEDIGRIVALRRVMRIGRAGGSPRLPLILNEKTPAVSPRGRAGVMLNTRFQGWPWTHPVKNGGARMVTAGLLAVP